MPKVDPVARVEQFREGWLHDYREMPTRFPPWFPMLVATLLLIAELIARGKR